jgi:multidrug efflux pump subunit AcrA (membrane-fusion protein)
VELKVDNADERVRPVCLPVLLELWRFGSYCCADLAIVKQAGSGDRFVYVYKDGKVSYDKVELGRRMADRYEILSGLTDGDQVVVSGQSRLVNGNDVEVVK